MKISAFNPTVLTSNPENVLDLFKDFGFEIRHNDKAEEGLATGSYRLKDENGFYIDITSSEHFPKDMTLIRMSVDNFEEGYKLLEKHGFKNALGENEIIKTPHWIGADMVSDSGLRIMLMHHIKKD